MSLTTRFVPRSARSWGLLALLLVILAAFVGMTGADAAILSPIQNVSRDNAQSILPHVAQDPRGNLHIVWDSQEGSRVIRYAKGTWNGTGYDFGASAIVANVGNYQYSTPNIAVAPNGVVMASWSDGSIKIRTWNSQDNTPSGVITTLGPGIQSTIAADSRSLFHVAWNGDFQIQYCEWNGLICAKREGFSPQESNRPDIAVDSNDNVHLVYDSGQATLYRARAARGEFSPVQRLGNGNFPQITADGQGNVHLVISRNFDIIYCRKTFTTDCTDQRTFDSAADLQPTIGATRGGSIVVVYRDADFRGLWYAARERGVWSASLTAGETTTIPDVTSRPYTSRLSVVWSRDFDIQHRLVSVVADPCDNRLANARSEWLGEQAIPANGRWLPLVIGGPASTDPGPTPPVGCN
jgi:hypothetical protein